MKLNIICTSIIFCLTFSVNCQNIYDARQSVMLEATVQENPPRINLKWVADTANGGYTIWRKAKYDTSWGDSIAVLGASSTSWIDTNVIIGMDYEYQIKKSLPKFPYGNGKPNFGAGYLYSGIKIPPTHFRGACLLVIDSSFKNALQPEIKRLIGDLESDGWQGSELYVSKVDPVTKVKSSIKTWAQIQKDSNLAVLLLGRVPVPYSGEIAPDGHQNDHRGAWPCDGYYACLDGEWTDNKVNINSPGYRQDNIPGDGKYDNNTFPAKLKLQIGRVDFANMDKFPESEEQLLRRYLNKDHQWRIGKMPMMERALVDNNFGDIEGLGESGWKNFTAMFGKANVKDIQYRQTLLNQSYMWSYGCGGGGPESASDISSTTSFTTDSLQTAFTMLFGSYFGDWDYPNNFLRGAIASRTCLASTWGNRPVWFFQHMALGEHIGYSAKATMSNTGLYWPPYYGIYVHSALMGDPTLRMHMFRPIENLIAVQQGLHVKLTWQDPVNALGYFVYRKSESDSVYTLLNKVPVTTTMFIDSCAGNGQLSFMVRSMELKTSGSGSYYNLSAGVRASVLSDPGPFKAVADFASSVYFDLMSLTNKSKNSKANSWNFGDGTLGNAISPNHLFGQTGKYNVCLQASDGCYVDTLCKEITISESSIPQVIANIEDATCFGTASGKISLSTIGGTPQLYFKWSALPDTTKAVQNILSGNYTCTITSATGNNAVFGPYTVGQPAQWLINPVITMVTPGQANGSVSLDPQGGCAPYSFDWNTGQNTSVIQNLNVGNYCATITDCLGCKQVYCAVVDLKNSSKEWSDITSYKLYPSPAHEMINLELNFIQSEEINVYIVNTLGQQFDLKRGKGTNIQLNWDIKNLIPSIYWFKIESSKRLLMLPFIKNRE